MSNMIYDGFIDDVLLKGSGEDFISPANQAAYLDKQVGERPLWMADHSSRCNNRPYWTRGELLRAVSYQDTRDVSFHSPVIEFPSSVATPAGELSLRTVTKPSSIIIPDRKLYHYNAQKVFAILSQFNVLTEQQIQALLGLDEKMTHEACHILYQAGVIESSGKTWNHYDTSGELWWMKIGSPQFYNYYNNMDALSKMLTLGGFEDHIKPPPGSNGASVLRHNLFCADIALRLAENGDHVAGIWGDMFGAEHNFHTPTDNMERRKSHGDAIIVTDNGSLIILELSTSYLGGHNSFKDIMDKAASWVGVIANSDLDISVIFIDSRWRVNRQLLFRAVYTGVMDASPAYCPDVYSREKALHHIGIANAAWWFPEDNTMSQAATRMVAFAPSIHDYRAFDQPDPQFSDSDTRKNVIINTAAALHTPPWITHDIVERDFHEQ